MNTDLIKENIRKYGGFVVLVLVIVGGVFMLNRGKVEAPIDNIEVPDNTIGETPDTKPDPTPAVDGLTKEQETLRSKLKASVDARDFETFANIMGEVYKNQWGGKKEFSSLESELYVFATNEYWVKGDLAKALEVSTTVYNKAPEGWRFRYLRIVVLEKYGRNALNAGDLNKAEEYANTILQMMFRPEGANLLADVYISRINKNIKDQDLNSAKQNLGFIWDFEVSADRRTTLESLKTQLGL